MAEQQVTRENHQGNTLSRRAPPLDLENVYEAVKRVREWRELGFWLVGTYSKLDAIRDQRGSDDEACLKGVIETFLVGECRYPPSWRAVIWALYHAGDNHIAHDIITYAEPVQDPAMTLDVVTQIFDKINGDKAKMMRFGLWIPNSLVDEIMRRRFSTDSERSHAFADVYVSIHPNLSWENLTSTMYLREEFACARESKSFMATDPSLNVDNVSRIMKKAEPKTRHLVWRSVLAYSNVYDGIKRQYSPDEWESACVDVYVHSHPFSEWEDLAKSLYRQHQMVAVEELRSYLPRRDLTITTEKLKKQFASLDPKKLDMLGGEEYLGLPASEVDNIKSSYVSHTQRKEAYLDLYVHQHPCPSWANIASTLRMLDLDQQADFVENTYVKVSEKTQQSFDTAMLEGEVSIRNGSALLVGVGGSGKSHVLAAILEEDAPVIRESTPCTKTPVRTVTHCKAEVSDTRFVRITDSHYSDLLVATSERLPKPIATTTTKAAATLETQIENLPLASSSVVNVDAVQDNKTWCARRAMKRELLRRKQEGLKKEADLNDKEIIDFRDTAGQSMFHEVLPVFVRNTMFGMVTVKLNEKLDSYPKIDYYIRGERVGEPFDSTFTHLETFRHCMRVIRSTCDPRTPPKLAFVGTHKDLLGECLDEDMEKKEKKLKGIIPPVLEDSIVTCGGSLLHAVNVKLPGDDDKKVISMLRRKMIEELRKRKPSRIPLRYVPLELAFRRLAKEQSKAVLSKEECFQIAGTYNFDRESFEAALKYLHGLNLIFYYEDVLPNVVFIDAQALLDKITELIIHSLAQHAKSTSDLFGALKKFVKCGIVTMDILSEFESHYVPNVFRKDDLIKVFIHLRIIAKVGDGEYLMPCLLKRVKALPRLMPGMSSLVVVPALLFYFGPDGPQLGVYCFLLSSLITDAGWKLLKEGHYPVQVCRNQAKFELPGGNPGCVTITDSFSSFFHVAIEPPEDTSDERIHQIYEEECSAIREAVLTGIRKALQKLNYIKSTPKVAFACSKHETTSLHPATVFGNDLLICTDNRRVCCEMTPLHQLWFNNKDRACQGSSTTDLVVSPSAEAAAPTVKSENATAADVRQDGTSTGPHNYQPPITDYLVIDDLCDVQAAIWDARSKWYDVGVNLRISPDTLDVIRENERNICDPCFREMLKVWLRRTEPRPTWMYLAKALTSPMVGYGHLADKLPPQDT